MIFFLRANLIKISKNWNRIKALSGFRKFFSEVFCFTFVAMKLKSKSETLSNFPSTNLGSQFNMNSENALKLTQNTSLFGP